MKTLRCSTVLIPTLLLALAACGTTTTRSGGGPTASTTSPVVEVTNTLDRTAVSAPVITAAPLTPPVTAPPATTPPTAAPAATAPPATTPPAATTPPVTAPPATAPPVTAPPAPRFNSFSVSNVTRCAEGGDGYAMVTVAWDISGATSVYLAIDNEYGPYEQNLPSTGSLDVPGPGCSEPNIYYVVAESPTGRTVQQATRTGA